MSSKYILQEKGSPSQPPPDKLKAHIIGKRTTITVSLTPPDKLTAHITQEHPTEEALVPY